MSEKQQRFIELMGQHVEEDGVPRIYGRLLAALLLNAQPSSLDDLAEQLQVSKGSVSSNARSLQRAGIAERITVPGDRRDYYKVTDAFVDRMMQRQLERQRVLIERLQVGQEAAREAPDHVLERFEQVIRQMRELVENTEELISSGAVRRE